MSQPFFLSLVILGCFLNFIWLPPASATIISQTLDIIEVWPYQSNVSLTPSEILDLLRDNSNEVNTTSGLQALDLFIWESTVTLNSSDLLTCTFSIYSPQTNATELDFLYYSPKFNSTNITSSPVCKPCNKTIQANDSSDFFDLFCCENITTIDNSVVLHFPLEVYEAVREPSWTFTLSCSESNAEEKVTTDIEKVIPFQVPVLSITEVSTDPDIIDISNVFDLYVTVENDGGRIPNSLLCQIDLVNAVEPTNGTLDGGICAYNETNDNLVCTYGVLNNHTADTKHIELYLNYTLRDSDRHDSSLMITCRDESNLWIAETSYLLDIAESDDSDNWIAAIVVLDFIAIVLALVIFLMCLFLYIRNGVIL